MRATFRQVAAAGAVVVSLGVAPALAQSFVFNLDGRQEVPPVGTNATGICAAVFQESQLHLTCTLGMSSQPTGAAIHHGGPGELGPTLHVISDVGQDFNTTWSLTPDQQAHLLTQDLYVNVSTAAHPSGEIRGQIRLQTFMMTNGTRIASLEGSQVLPPVSTTADGRCLAAFVRSDPAKFTVICNHTALGATSAHLHVSSDSGVTGLIATFSSGSSPLQKEIGEGDPGFPDLIRLFALGRLYVDVHTPTHPDGELRGQLAGCVNSPMALCLNGGRFQVWIEWRTLSNHGDGVAVSESADSGMFWFFGPDNTEVLIKVLNACSAPYNRYWVFFAPTTNVGFTLHVLDTKMATEKTYQNALGHQAQTVLDTDAFATCP
ncbi:MAG: CHRD domain-containing protein [Acidobacteriota bacterium]